MNKIIKPAIILLSSIFLASCATLKTKKPVESYTPPVYNPQSSIINIPFEISEAALEKEINNQTKGLLYEDNNLNDDDLMLKVWKKDNDKISLKLSNNQISYRVPLKLWIKTGFKIEKFGVTVSDYREINAEIALKFITTYSINKDWTLKTTTTANGYEWLASPTVKIAGFDVPVKKIADIVLKSQLKTMAPMIDQQVAKLFDLKKVASSAWINIQKPTLVNEIYKVWMRNTPQEISMTPITVTNGILRASIGIKTIAETFLNKQPEALVPTALPALNIITKPTGEYKINLYVDVPYKTIDSLSKINMINQTFSEGKKKITIKDLSIYGSENKIIVNTTVDGSLKGNIFFTAIPYYETETQSIRLKEVDFQVDTKNALVKSSNWLLHSTINSLIEKKMSYSIKSYLDEYTKMTQEYLNNYKIANQLFLNGKITKLDVGDVILLPDVIRVMIICEGTATVSLK